LLETTKLIVMTQGKEAAVIGTLVGPCSLVKTVLGDKDLDIGKVMSLVGNLLTKLTKNLCELRVDAVFFREDLLGAGYRDELSSQSQRYAGVYTTLFNLITYYNSYPVLMVKEMELDFITDLHNILGPSGVILLGKKVNDDDLIHVGKLSESLKMSFGLPLPMVNQDDLLEQFAVISQFIGKRKPQGFFYVSDGEIPYDIHLEILHDLIAKMRSTEKA